MYGNPARIAADLADYFEPPRRERPSAVAQRVLRTEKGPWDPLLVPYLIEPLDQLAAREYQGIVFVGPARAGKTLGLVLGAVSYVVVAAPGDMLLVHTTQDTARDFSRTDLDRAIRHSEDLSSRMSSRPRDDNTFDKFFRSGVSLKVAWPTIAQLSAKTIHYALLTDYDRSENADDVDGEGPLWDLARKRTETMMSRGKTLAESSPGREHVDESWRQRSRHEAPPVRGILSLYNRGTRARWYWPCLSCFQHFQARPGPDAFALPSFEEICEEVARRDLGVLVDAWFRVPCPHCGALHSQEDRRELTAARTDGDRIVGATWLHEGEELVDGRIVGQRRDSDIASYWLGGVAAAYQQWHALGLAYLQAVLDYVLSGDESPLKKSTTADMAAPYMPQAVRARKGSHDYRKRTEDALARGVVPQWVRFLTASVDTQAHRFVVHVEGWAPERERVLVDRFDVTASDRPEGDRFAALDPAAYVEDWLVLRPRVIERAYRIEGSALELRPVVTLCDSGGREGVTERAYAFWRTMRDAGLGRTFMLVKGTGNLEAPRAQLTWPDSRGNRKQARGDVPVWQLNVNVLKDTLRNDLAREIPGPGFIHYGSWLPATFFDELAAETRTAKGWERRGHQPNEALDLHGYNCAAYIIVGAERIDWRRPPEWARDHASREAAAKASTEGRVAVIERNWTTDF